MNKRMELDAAYAAMEAAARSGWRVTEVDWPCLDDFHASLRAFENRLKLQEMDDAWNPFLRYCRSYRFFLVATPLSAPLIVEKMQGWSMLSGLSLVQLKGTLDATALNLYSKLLQTFNELQRENINPLAKAAVTDLLATGQSEAKIAVLSPDARLSASIRHRLSRLLRSGDFVIRSLRPAELKTREIYDELLVFGPTRRRFSDGSEFVYAAPRARSLRLYTPAGFPTSIPTPYRFEGSPHQSGKKSGVAPFSSFAAPSLKRAERSETREKPLETEVDQDWLDSLPTIVVPSGTFEDREDGEEWECEPVSAKQVLLSADHAVFLDPESSLYRINRERKPGQDAWICTGVEHSEVRDIGPGDVLLFQAAGGGSMVAELADQILGGKAQGFRAAQDLWKTGLRTFILVSSSTRAVRKRLQQMGSSIRSDATVRNWCTSWNIGPGSWRDFDSLLEIIGLSAERERIFEATRAIRAAHRKAGFELANQLLKLIEGQPLNELVRTGSQEFGGAGGAPNRKIAYEVVALLPEECEVLPNRLNQPFPLHK